MKQVIVAAIIGSSAMVIAVRRLPKVLPLKDRDAVKLQTIRSDGSPVLARANTQLASKRLYGKRGN